MDTIDLRSDTAIRPSPAAGTKAAARPCRARSSRSIRTSPVQQVMQLDLHGAGIDRARHAFHTFK